MAVEGLNLEKNFETIIKLDLQTHESEVIKLFNTIDYGHVLLNKDGKIKEVRGYMVIDNLPIIFRCWPIFGSRDLKYNRSVVDGKIGLKLIRDKTDWYPTAPHSSTEWSSFIQNGINSPSDKEFYLDLWGQDTEHIKDARTELIDSAKLLKEKSAYPSFIKKVIQLAGSNDINSPEIQAMIIENNIIRDMELLINSRIENDYLSEKDKRIVQDMKHKLILIMASSEKKIDPDIQDEVKKELMKEIIIDYNNKFNEFSKNWGVGRSAIYDKEEKKWIISEEFIRVYAYSEAVTRFSESLQIKLNQHRLVKR